ncbi:MAG TPA: hypothetical protein VI485_11775 [Vicinamibacterales bacterium]|nr:hypothetical protein [Vicinamibacterales bacterium]
MLPSPPKTIRTTPPINQDRNSQPIFAPCRRLHELNRLSISYPAEIDFHSDAELTARVSNPESELAHKVLSIQLRSDSFSVLPTDPVPLTLTNGQERRFIARPTQYGLRRVLVSVRVNGPPNPLPKGVSLSSALDDWSIAIRVREPTRLFGIPEFYFNVTLVSGIVVLLLSAVGWIFVRVSPAFLGI